MKYTQNQSTVEENVWNLNIVQQLGEWLQTIMQPAPDGKEDVLNM